jgi:hypothetical protein
MDRCTFIATAVGDIAGSALAAEAQQAGKVSGPSP